MDGWTRKKKTTTIIFIIIIQSSCESNEKCVRVCVCVQLILMLKMTVLVFLLLFEQQSSVQFSGGVVLFVVAMTVDDVKKQRVDFLFLLAFPYPENVEVFESARLKDGMKRRVSSLLYLSDMCFYVCMVVCVCMCE